nr:FAD-dependent monooxygenase [Protofrankia coriariae]
MRSGARVVLVERATSFDREYRGEILQPGGALILDQLGVLDGARKRGHYECSRFRIVSGGRPLFQAEYDQIEPPYNHFLSIPQPNVLEELFDACKQYDRFEYLDGRSPSGLLLDGERVVGVTLPDGDTEQRINARCVIAADGRHSKTRRLADITFTKIDAFDYDMVWFKLPAPQRHGPEVTVFQGDGNPIIVYDAYPDSLQLGWTLPRRSYRSLAQHGIEHIKEQIRQSVPRYADLITKYINVPGDLAVLDVFAGFADTWARDGLLLIGDAAHTHGPIGGQGINLAIQDAALAHPILVSALAAGSFDRDTLGQFEQQRRPVVETVTQMQARQAKLLFARPGGPPPDLAAEHGAPGAPGEHGGPPAGPPAEHSGPPAGPPAGHGGPATPDTGRGGPPTGPGTGGGPGDGHGHGHGHGGPPRWSRPRWPAARRQRVPGSLRHPTRLSPHRHLRRLISSGKRCSPTLGAAASRPSEYRKADYRTDAVTSLVSRRSPHLSVSFRVRNYDHDRLVVVEGKAGAGPAHGPRLTEAAVVDPPGLQAVGIQLLPDHFDDLAAGAAVICPHGGYHVVLESRESARGIRQARKRTQPQRAAGFLRRKHRDGPTRGKAGGEFRRYVHSNGPPHLPAGFYWVRHPAADNVRVTVKTHRLIT